MKLEFASQQNPHALQYAGSQRHREAGGPRLAETIHGGSAKNGWRSRVGGRLRLVFFWCIKKWVKHEIQEWNMVLEPSTSSTPSHQRVGGLQHVPFGILGTGVKPLAWQYHLAPTRFYHTLQDAHKTQTIDMYIGLYMILHALMCTYAPD